MENKIFSTQRFSDVVENYIKYRPGYPPELISILNKTIGLTPNKIIADIGSGTGKSSELFLQNKNIVFAVEPNDPMREAAEAQFHHLLNFRSIKGTAEATHLSSDSIDMIIAGQAFHWFDPRKARKEFKRVLKPSGWVVLIWNDRNDQIPFLQEYEKFLLENSIDYSEVNHRNVDKSLLTNFFGTDNMGYTELSYQQRFTFDGLKGRYLSCSYAYNEDHALFTDAINKLHDLYKKFEEDGEIKMDYTTKIYFAQLKLQ